MGTFQLIILRWVGVCVGQRRPGIPSAPLLAGKVIELLGLLFWFFFQFF